MREEDVAEQIMKRQILKTKIILAMLTGLLVACAPAVKENMPEKFPPPKSWVSDREDLYTDTQENTLDSLVREYEAQTSVEIAVVTIPGGATDRNGFDLDVLRLANTWGVGKKGKDNGILIGISRGLKGVRISTGKGIQARLTDLRTRQVIDSTMVPEFRRARFFEGTLGGIREIISVLDSKYR